MAITNGDPTPRTMMTEIGGWKLGKTLGRGAYAHVRLATHRSGHTAACKILPALHRGKRYNRDQMMDAVEAHKELVLLKGMAGAGLPGIVGLEGVMSHQGWNYIFLSLYPKSASGIKDWSDRRLLVPFFRKLCIAVDGLHKLHISHEDLKRSNVLITNKMEPILADFGFSHLSPGGKYVTSLGGTADYSSPEKTKDAAAYDGAANDVWSLGILLIKLLGREHPYAWRDECDPDADWRIEMVKGRQPRWDFSAEELERGGIGYLIHRMLDRNPYTRYTINQVLRHPALLTTVRDPPPFVVSLLTIPKDIKEIPKDVVMDVAFLAFNNGNFALCQSWKVIEDDIKAGTPWMLQWVGMLGSWKARAETKWEDVTTTPSSKTVRSPVIKNKKEAVQASRLSLRPLRVIQLSPNAQKTAPIKEIHTKTPPMKNKGVRHAHVTDRLHTAAQNLAKHTGMTAVQSATGDMAGRAVAVGVKGNNQRIGTKAPSSVQFGTAHVKSAIKTTAPPGFEHRPASMDAHHNDSSAPAFHTGSVGSNHTPSGSSVTIIDDAGLDIWHDTNEYPEAFAPTSNAIGVTTRRGRMASSSRGHDAKRADKENVAPPDEKPTGIPAKASRAKLAEGGALRRSTRFHC